MTAISGAILRRAASLSLGTMLVALAMSGPLAADDRGGERIFTDSFELGHVSAWSRFQPQDSAASTLDLIEPQQSLIFNDPTPAIVLGFRDPLSGVDLSSLSIQVDDQVISGCRLSAHSAACEAPALDSGFHALQISLADRQGNTVELNQQLEIVLDTVPPQIVWQSPIDGSLLATPQVSAEALVNDADDQVSAIRINGSGQVPDGKTVTANVALQAGANELWIEAVDRAGNLSRSAIEVTLDLIPPTIALLEPSPGALTQRPTVRFRGSVSDDHGVEGLWIEGSPVALMDGDFDLEVPLVEGVNDISLLARDSAGREVQWTVAVERVTVPEVVITSPVDRQRISTTTVDVSGAFNGSVAGIWVNGIPATLDAGTFTVDNVPLDGGATALIAAGFTAGGSTSTDKITVLRDLESPILGVSEPLPGSETFAATTTVIGAVRDCSPRTV